MAHPLRIQLSRKKGYRKPEGAVVVSRPTIFGNPFRRGDRLKFTEQPWAIEAAKKAGIGPNKPLTSEQAVTLYRAYMEGNRDSYLGKHMRALLDGMRGKQLACWCKLTDACHADILCELANA